MITVKTGEDSPYGLLSLQKGNITIDEHEWTSPCHYILSHMFPPGILRQSIVRASNAVQAYNNACDKIEVNNIAIVEYLEYRCKIDSNFVQELVKTGNAKLFSTSFPKNIYGKFLEQKRYQLLNSADVVEGDTSERGNTDPVFYMYLAERALKELLSESDLQDLVDYNFLRMSDLLRHLEKRYGRERIFKKAPDRATIIQIHKQRGVDYTTNPTTLIKLVRRQNIRRINNNNEQKFKDHVFHCFIQSIKHLHPARSFERDDVIAYERTTIPFNDLQKFIKRTFELYKNGSLGRDVISLVERRQIFLLSEEQVQKYESEVFALHPGTERLETQQSNHFDNTKHTIDVNTIHTFNPFAVYYVLINGFNFPTLAHYCVFKHILYESNDVEPFKVFQKISSIRPDNIIPMLTAWIAKNRNVKMKKLVDKTFSKLFQDDQNQHLLLSTGKSELIVHCSWFSELGQNLVQYRNKLVPRIHRIINVDDVKLIPLVQSWIHSQRQLVYFIKQIYDNWFETKQCLGEITTTDIFKYFFNKSKLFYTFDDYICFMLEQFRKMPTDLQIHSYIFQMQYNFCNRWVRRKNQPKLADDKYNAQVVALCKLLLVFDRLTKSLVTLDEIDVDFAKKLLTDTSVQVPEEYFIADNDEIVENNDVESDIEYNEDDFDDYFEGHDEIYRFLANQCHNNLSSDIETYIFEVVSKMRIDPHIRSRINFFAT
jgi:hypothetical protein